MASQNKCIALDLGGTKLLIGIVTDTGEILESRSYPSPLAGGGQQTEIAAYMRSCLRDFLSCHPACGASCIGAGVVGRVDGKRGLWLEIESGRCETVELARFLEDACGLPCRVDNDVRCALRAEQVLGHGKGLDDFIYINIGTGIASAMVSGGRVITGGSFNAGETGHFAVDISGGVQCPCGRTGCAEAIASGSGLNRRARELRPRYPDSRLEIPKEAPCRAQDIFRLAREGDALCARLAQDAQRAAAALIENLVWTLDPKVIGLGGGIVADSWMYAEIIKRLSKNSMRFTTGVYLTSLDPRCAGLIGAAMCGFDLP